MCTFWCIQLKVQPSEWEICDIVNIELSIHHKFLAHLLEIIQLFGNKCEFFRCFKIQDFCHFWAFSVLKNGYETRLVPMSPSVQLCGCLSYWFSHISEPSSYLCYSSVIMNTPAWSLVFYGRGGDISNSLFAIECIRRGSLAAWKDILFYYDIALFVFFFSEYGLFAFLPWSSELCLRFFFGRVSFVCLFFSDFVF